MSMILKIGGHELDDTNFLAGLLVALKALPELPILVHGGGKEVSALQEKLGLEPQTINGLRVTDADTLDAVLMVLAGRINKRLVAALAAAGFDAMGLTGIDRGAVTAQKRVCPQGDLGLVGEVKAVRIEVFRELLAGKVLPVLAPLCLGSDGGILNVNADNVACAVAVAMDAEQLVFISNIPGIMAKDKVLPAITASEAEELIAGGIIAGGMQPKVESALKALQAGVKEVRITNLEGLRLGGGTRIH